ncbi:hypothetical protein [Dyella jiangningensis]
MVDLVRMLSYRKGENCTYRPEAGTTCLISGEHCDNDEGYTYMEMEILWKDDLFVVYRKPGCWPVISKWEHIIAKPLTETIKEPGQ